MTGVARTHSLPMRDGVALATDVYLPAASARPAPALLVRTPYGRQRFEAVVYAHPSRYAARGYAVVCQDVRGRGDSEGDFRPFAQEGPDGHDSVEWIAAQPWCDSRVGMYGFSYPGFAQLAAAGQRPPHLRAVAPAMTAADPGGEWLRESGILRLAFVLWWGCELGKGGAVRAGDEEALYELVRVQRHLEDACLEYSRRRSLPPALERVAPFVREWVSCDEGDERGRAPAAGAGVAGFFLAGWYDTFLEGTIAAFQRARASGAEGQYLVIGPWQHVPWARRVGELDFGAGAVSRIDSWALEFFDATLREDGGPLDWPPVRVFVTGSNSWLSLAAWPPPGGEEVAFHLAGGPANSCDGEGELAPEPDGREVVDRYVVDPWDPARGVGGRSCCDPDVTPMGPRDCSAEQRRGDRLIFDARPLRDPLTVIGSPRVRLGFATDTATTDLVVRLCDVDRDGAAYGVSEGAVRLSGPRPPEGLEVVLSPLATSFERGHRIRLELTGASFPARELNLQTPEGDGEASLLGARVGVHALHRGGPRESCLWLPVRRGWTPGPRT